MTDVVVLGAGALGSLYGAAFASAGCEVTLLARSAHAAVIDSHGLIIESSAGERVVRTRAVSNPEALPAECDVLLVAAKAYDVPRLLSGARTRPRIALSVQNGIGKDDSLRAAYGPGAVVGCVSMVGGTLLEPGRVAHTFEGATYVGGLPQGRIAASEEIAALLARGGLPTEVYEDIRPIVWSKAVLAVAAMGVTGLTRLPYHCVFLDDDAAELFLDLVEEAAQVAAAEGVALLDLPGPLQIATLATSSRPKARDVLRAVGETMASTGQTDIRVSTLQAIETGRRTEVDAVHGDMVALARGHHIETPVIETVTRVLRAIDANIEEE